MPHTKRNSQEAGKYVGTTAEYSYRIAQNEENNELKVKLEAQYLETASSYVILERQ
jgi:hypothetical protein